MSEVFGKMCFKTVINYKDSSLSQQMFLVDPANFINMWLNSSFFGMFSPWCLSDYIHV